VLVIILMVFAGIGLKKMMVMEDEEEAKNPFL
jgi:hypothetical protein